MQLRIASSPNWALAVLADFDAFLLDHAACERKAASTALSLVAHYPNRTELVRECIDLAREELEHFRLVHDKLTQKGLILAPDTKDPYVGRLRREFRQGSEEYFLDRLLICGIVEARGCERFGVLAASLDAGPWKDFYRELARSEARHHELFERLALLYFDGATVTQRRDELLDVEARVLAELPLRAAVH